MLSPSAAVASRLRSGSFEPVYYVVIAKSEGFWKPGSGSHFWPYTSGVGGGLGERTFTTGPVSWSDRTTRIDDYNLHEGRLNRKSVGDLVVKLAAGERDPGGVEATSSFKISLDNLDGHLFGANPGEAFKADIPALHYQPDFMGRTIASYLTFSDITSRADSLLYFSGRVTEVDFKKDRLELTIKSGIINYDETVPPNIYENIAADLPRGVSGQRIPIVFGAHDKAPGYLVQPVGLIGAVDAAPILNFCDVSFADIQGLNTLLYADSGFVNAGVAEVVDTAPLGFTEETPYATDDATANIGFTEEPLEVIYCRLAIMPTGYSEDFSGTASIQATDPDHAIDGDLATFSVCNYVSGEGHHSLKLRLPTMSSSLSLLKDTGSGKAAAFLWWNVDTVAGSIAGNRAQFISEKTGLESSTDALGVKLIPADDGVYDTIGDAPAGLALFQLEDQGSITWDDYDTLADLSKRYFSLSGSPTGGGTFHIYEIKVLVYFTVPLPDSGFYADMGGFVDPAGGPFTGSAGGLIENPAHVMSFFCYYLSGSEGASIDADYNNSVLAPARSSWAFARSLTKEKDFLDYVESLGREGLFWVTSNEEGALRGVPWEASGAGGDTDILIAPRDLEGGEIERFKKTPSEAVVSDFKFKFNYNPARDDYDGLVFCNATDSSSELGAEYEEVCAWSDFNNGGRSRAETFEFDWVRDRATMLEIAKRLFVFHSGRRWTITLACDLALITAQVGDRLDIDPAAIWPDSYPPEMTRAKYRISEARLKASRDLVTIKASEVF